MFANALIYIAQNIAHSAVFVTLLVCIQMLC